MARVDVLMPQMGESIAEGTLSKWLKKVGDPVKRDEPLFEISTDKVDAEIPAPAAGVLAEIKVQEGQTVPVQTLVAVLETEAGATAAKPAVARRPCRALVQDPQDHGRSHGDVAARVGARGELLRSRLHARGAAACQSEADLCRARGEPDVPRVYRQSLRGESAHAPDHQCRRIRRQHDLPR